MWHVFGETQSKQFLKKLQNRAARFTANMTNDVDQTVVLHAYWAGKQGKRAKMKYKVLNKMGPE